MARWYCTDLRDDRATVVREPSWLGRLFGVRPLVYQVMRKFPDQWLFAASQRRVSTDILDALDSAPVGESLPVAMLRSR